LICRINVAPSRPQAVLQLHSVDCAPADYEAPALIANR
jgi:hypothetical protein